MAKACNDRLEAQTSGLSRVNAIAKIVVGIAAAAIDRVVAAHHILERRYELCAAVGKNLVLSPAIENTAFLIGRCMVVLIPRLPKKRARRHMVPSR